MNTELILIRHGETDLNKEKKYFGHTDVKLNKNGISEIKKLSKKIENYDLIYSSDLKRTIESANLIKKENEKIILNKNLREFNFGIFENKTYEEINTEYKKEAEQFFNDHSYVIPEGESAIEMKDRVIKEIKEIIEKNTGKKILLFTHAGCIRTIISYFLIGDLSLYWRFQIDNASKTKLVFSEDFVHLEYLNMK